ncbi:hypothetical protein LNAOJCKE_1566 [Methylorubrum aminovorans]|uniref:Uncharacterized protein n=1 Tax=Methylorubrum aminovorans TaxID=269069 RepID=A0ABQ4UBZ3_9HYPH|nr:hypothetical protein LNAOJCKE_1566 [Methylorubrum aminovorans]
MRCDFNGQCYETRCVRDATMHGLNVYGAGVL